MGSDEQVGVVELRLIAEHMGIRVRCHRQVPLADELANPGPRNAAQMQEADPSMPQIMRAEERNAGGSACLCDRGAKRVGADSDLSKKVSFVKRSGSVSGLKIPSSTRCLRRIGLSPSQNDDRRRVLLQRWHVTCVRRLARWNRARRLAMTIILGVRMRRFI
jgi:hypothetical protein